MPPEPSLNRPLQNEEIESLSACETTTRVGKNTAMSTALKTRIWAMAYRRRSQKEKMHMCDPGVIIISQELTEQGEFPILRQELSAIDH